MRSELTRSFQTARVCHMQGTCSRTRPLVRFTLALAWLTACGVGLSGCVSVNAPDKPIVIELNINIKQPEPQLAEGAKATVDNNKDIF